MKRHILFKIAMAISLLGLSARLATAQEAITQLTEEVSPAVVALIAYNDKGEVIEWGNGFFLSRDGRLLTSRRLLEGASRAAVQTREGNEYPVKAVIAEDSGLDLIELLIDLKGDEVTYLRMTDINAAEGEEVTAFGHQHIIHGTVSYSQPLAGSGKDFLIQAATTARATGGPVVNKKGEVIAIATEQAVGGQSVALAVAAGDAIALVPTRLETLSAWNARNRRRRAGSGSHGQRINLVLPSAKGSRTTPERATAAEGGSEEARKDRSDGSIRGRAGLFAGIYRL